MFDASSDVCSRLCGFSLQPARRFPRAAREQAKLTSAKRVLFPTSHKQHPRRNASSTSRTLCVICAPAVLCYCCRGTTSFESSCLVASLSLDLATVNSNMASVVYAGVGGGGQLFAGMKFFLLQRLPTRDRFKELVKVCRHF
jgi:hypothetical protein